MPLYEILPDTLRPLTQTTLVSERIRERQDLQRLVRDQVEILEEGLLVIAEEFGEWEESRRRIDLLAVDRQANLVVIELKRDDTGGHMELQALRYAAMVSTLTFEKCAEVFDAYLLDRGREHQDASELLLSFLGWTEPDEDSFAQDVRIVLVAADFGKELTTAVLWLNQRDLDIRCVRLQPYSDGTRVLLSVQQVIPLPEAEEFQIQVREKALRERKARTDNRDLTRYNVKVRERSFPDQPKRGALFHIVTTLVREMGIAPERIHEADLSRPFDRVWVVVDGEVDEPTFIERATRDRKGQGYAFAPPRWYTADDELLRHDGRTYAFSKMWGGTKWRKAMENLKRTFPEARIEFEPVE
jgi:hypothetical protein